MILPETFDLAAPLAADFKPAPTQGRVEPYLRGPIPLAWLQKAIGLNHSALATSLAIWHLRALKKAETFQTNLRTLGKLTGLSEKATRAGLTSLEKAGLVQVERPRGKNMVITLIATNPSVRRAPQMAAEERPGGEGLIPQHDKITTPPMCLRKCAREAADLTGAS